MMTDPIVLEQALAAAKVNVKGTGQPERARPSTAEESDRTPNWNKWRLIPNLEPWQCAALWSDIDPYKVKLINNAWMAEGSVHRFDESQDFKDRVELVEDNQYGALKSKGCPSGKVDLRVFAAWAREAQKEGWKAPAELLAMADDRNRTASDRRTGPATATREARKADRSRDLQRFIDDVYEALDNAGHEIGEKGDRKPLPVSAGDLRFAFATLNTRLRGLHSTTI